MAASPLFIILLQVFLSSITINICESANITKFPAILIFGDSLLDTGNNNFIATPFQANHNPYGQSFPGIIPTGRFSNGKLMSDIIASSLGIKSTVPPALDPTLSDDDIRTGVCFASAGSGYDDVTTMVSGVFPVSMQTKMLAAYINRLKGIVGKEEAARTIDDNFENE